MQGYRAHLLLSLLPAVLAPVARAQSLRVIPLRGDPVVVRDWSLGDGRVRGKAEGSRAAFSLSVRRVWVLEPLVAPAPPPGAEGPFLQIRRGPRLYGALSGGKDGKLQFDFRLGGKAEIAKTYLQGFRCGAASKDVGTGFAEALARPRLGEDLLYVYDQKGKVRRFPGKITGARGQALVVILRGVEREIGLDMVHGVVFAETSGLEAQPPEDGPGFATVRLHDGRLLRGVLADAASGAPLVLELLEGPSLRVPLAEIKDVELGSDKLVYLSSLSPKASRTPSLGRTWPLLKDQGLGGVPLTLGEKTYRKGFLVVPSVRLEFELPRAFDRLVGEVGMPRARFGSARLRVLAGGKQLGDVLKLAATGERMELVRALGGARALTIEVLATEDLDVGARVVLGDLRVVVD